MFQNFYDEQNNRFLIAPLRCGSRFTASMANNLGWRNLNDVFKDLTKEDSSIKNVATEHFFQNQSLKILYMLKSQKYRDSEWIMFVRNPWARYLSGASHILSERYDAPTYVPYAELKQVDKFLKGITDDEPDMSLRHSPYSDVDQQISDHFSNSIDLDYTLNDDHLIPNLTVQLMYYLENPEKVRLIKLENMTDFYKTHYPPGEAVQEDYYDLLAAEERPNSDSPSDIATGVYKRFLATTRWYNPIQAKRTGLTTSFHDFIQYDIDAWSVFQDNFDSMDTYTSQRTLEDLFYGMIQEPYFCMRNKKLYQFYTVGASTITTDSKVFNLVNLQIPKMREFILENSWINVQLSANF